MPKMKTHKGLTKRVRVTARGKVKYRQSYRGHLLSARSADRKRRLRQPTYLSHPVIARKMIRAMQES